MSTVDSPCTRNAVLRRSPASRARRTLLVALAVVAIGCAQQRFGATENNYYTKLRVTVDGAVARLAVIEDTSILPAMNDACEIGIGGR